MILAAVLACRNQSLRLYAKPLQYLDTQNGVTILDFLICQLKQHALIDQIILAISENKENEIYADIAQKHHIPHIFGDEYDVLKRLIHAGQSVKANQVLRVTTESPYLHLENFKEIYEYHCQNQIDYSVISGVPDGSFFEIIKMDALVKSWECGQKKHRSELCTSYIFDHQDEFKIKKHSVAEAAQSLDVRLTVDWPEDLIVLRKVFEDLKLDPHKPVSVPQIISYLRNNPKLNSINNWIDSSIGRIWY